MANWSENAAPRDIKTHEKIRQLEWKREMRLECLQDLIPRNDLWTKVTLFTEECARRVEEREKSSFSNDLQNSMGK